MNEGDAAGDLFFAIKSRALPEECAPPHPAYDCRDPELAASKLQISKVGRCSQPATAAVLTASPSARSLLRPSQVVVEIDCRYLATAGLYSECNVDENTSSYHCECRGAPHDSCDNHTIGVQTVRSLPFFKRPTAGSTDQPSWWRYNLAQLIGGSWWSTVGSGECAPGTRPPVSGRAARLVRGDAARWLAWQSLRAGAPAMRTHGPVPPLRCAAGRFPAVMILCVCFPVSELQRHPYQAHGCSWRLARTVKRVNKTCHDASMNKAVEARLPSCFAGCAQPHNTSSACWVDCFFKVCGGRCVPFGGRFD
jgi:hypothetical protein